MGTIKINVPAVLNAGSQAKKAKKTVTTANQNIRSIKNRIDPKVINKGDLSAKFRNIDSQLKSVSQKIDRMNSFWLLFCGNSLPFPHVLCYAKYTCGRMGSH
mgnify:CR=1 FL=1